MAQIASDEDDDDEPSALPPCPPRIPATSIAGPPSMLSRLPQPPTTTSLTIAHPSPQPPVSDVIAPTPTEMPSSTALEHSAAFLRPSPLTNPLPVKAHNFVPPAHSTSIAPEVAISYPTTEAVPDLAGDAQGVALANEDKKRRRKVGGGSTVTRKSARIPVPQKRNRSDLESGDVVATLGPGKKKCKKG